MPKEMINFKCDLVRWCNAVLLWVVRMAPGLSSGRFGPVGLVYHCVGTGCALPVSCRIVVVVNWQCRGGWCCLNLCGAERTWDLHGNRCGDLNQSL